MQRREGAYFQALALPSHFWFLLLPSRFCTFVSSAFSWHLILLKQKKRKNTKKKKVIENKKYAKMGGSLPSSFHSVLSFLALVFALLLLPFHFKHFLLTFFFPSNKRKKKHKEKKIVEKKKNVEKGVSFCIWDKTFFLFSPLHIPSTLSSPPFSSLVSTSLRSFVLLKLGER
jgi:hypothetical protein